jgi:hypothetical protein
MNDFLLWLFIGLCALGVVYVLWQPRRMFEFPAFMTFAFAAFILPQAISLVRFPGEVEVRSVTAVLIMSVLCLVCGWLGYFARPNATLLNWTARPVDMARLFHVGLAFSAISFLFQRALGSIDVQYAESGGMTGAGTILLFFQQLCYPGFAICLFCAVRRPTVINVVASIVGVLPLLQAVLIARREGTAQLALILVMAFFFQRKWIPPRWVFAVGLIGAMLLIPATGTYRRLSSEMGVSAVREIDYWDNFKRYVNEESPILELRNGAAVIEATRFTGDYQWGAAYWNHLVFRFVPAQIVGKRFKDWLSIGQASDFTERAVLVTGYELPPGSTVTGMGDTYQQFNWFGCLFFALMAVVFKSLWQAAQRPEAVFAQLLYVLSCTSAMRAVTHWTQDFLPGLLYFAIFLGIAMLYAATPTRMLMRRASGTAASAARGRHSRRPGPAANKPRS